MRLMTQIRFLPIVVCLLALSLCPVAFGQAVYGSIYGSVTDSTGAVIPNATVTVTDVSKGTSSKQQSNGSGEFTADHLIPDVYDVRVEVGGFESFEQKGIQIFADTSTKVAVV